MMETLVIAALFILALLYLGNMVRKNFSAKTGCAKGCGACSTIDFDKIEAQLKLEKKQ